MVGEAGHGVEPAPVGGEGAHAVEGRGLAIEGAGGRPGGAPGEVEFKLDTLPSDALAKKLASFSNFGGGVVLLGPEDDGSISGVGTATTG